jgi:hypothetical protein
MPASGERENWHLLSLIAGIRVANSGRLLYFRAAAAVLTRFCPSRENCPGRSNPPRRRLVWPAAHRDRRRNTAADRRGRAFADFGECTGRRRPLRPRVSIIDRADADSRRNRPSTGRFGSRHSSRRVRCGNRGAERRSGGHGRPGAHASPGPLAPITCL